MIVLYRKISITSNSIQHFLQQILTFLNKKSRNILLLRYFSTSILILLEILLRGYYSLYWQQTRRQQKSCS